jgi:hypothetical protein
VVDDLGFGPSRAAWAGTGVALADGGVEYDIIELVVAERGEGIPGEGANRLNVGEIEREQGDGGRVAAVAELVKIESAMGGVASAQDEAPACARGSAAMSRLIHAGAHVLSRRGAA